MLLSFRISLSASTVFLRIHQLGVVLTQQKIVAGHRRNQRCLHHSLSVLRGQQRGTRSFGRAAVLSPEVNNVIERQSGDVEGRRFGIELVALVGDSEAAIQRWKLVGARDPQVGVGLQDARGRDPHVVVIGEGLFDQALQHLVLKDRSPLQVCESLPRRRLCRSVGRNAAVRVGHCQRRTLVVRTYLAGT